MSTYTTKLIQTTEEFTSLKDQWIGLENKAKSCSYYSTFEYLNTWWSEYGKLANNKLFIPAAFNNNELIAVAPWYINSRRTKKIFNQKKLSFMGIGDYHEVLVKGNIPVKRENIFKDFLNMIYANKSEWDVINFINMPQDVDFVPFLLRTDFNPNTKFYNEAPFLIFGEYPNFEEYSKEFKHKHINLLKNKLTKEIKYTFEVCKGNQSAIFPEIISTHLIEKDHLNSLNQNENRHSPFEEDIRKDVIKKLYTSSENIITFMLRTPEKEVIAYNTSYIHNKKVFGWNMGFNTKYDSYSPSRVLFWLIIEYFFKSNEYEVFDQGAGRYPWKFRTTDKFRVVYCLNYENPESLYIKFKNNWRKKQFVKALILLLRNRHKLIR